MFEKRLSFLMLVGVSFSGICMEMPKKKFSDFDWDGASVLIYTNWKPGENFFMLAREHFGADKGTYDAFGGARERKDKNPMDTAAREFSEESMGLLGNQKSVNEHMALKKPGKLPNTRFIIANEAKKFVVYIVAYNPKDFQFLTDKFYKQKKLATKSSEKEKDMIAHVKESELRKTIENVKRDAHGKLITVEL